jgi:dTDP-4-amino-4,6-dideoxygalactose transaminase
LTRIAPTLEIPFHRACLGEEEAMAAAEVVRSGWLTMGPRTVSFEEELARYVGAEHAIAVSSCTAALHLALEACGVGPGDEVLLPTLTFTATAEVVTYLQARPVLVDSDPRQMNLCLKDAERKLSPRTKAIIPVHFAGHPCDMAAMQAFARGHGLKVVEDAAHALPAKYHGRMIGGLSDATAFSFYATKTLSTGEGGMITTNDPALASRMRLMRLHGMSRDAWKRYSGGPWRYDVLEAGYKYNLTDMQSAIGLVQLKKCDALRDRREEIAHLYAAGLETIRGFRGLQVSTDVQHAWHLYCIQMEEGFLRIGRDDVIRRLNERGIGTSVHFIPLHEHSYYRGRWNYAPGDFPVAGGFGARCLSIPLYPGMRDEEAHCVLNALSGIAREFRR